MCAIALSGFAEKQRIDVSAPLLTDSAGKTGKTAFNAVVRVICPSKGIFGTGFIHSSGRVITAAHVVSGCDVKDIRVIAANGNILQVSDVAADNDADLAALKLSEDPKMAPLFISGQTEFPIGTQVAIWGFPVGYGGGAPLLTVGYLAGIDRIQVSDGKFVARLIVNAAFNGGNSGGPIINVEDGSVIGVVASKLAPIPQEIESALQALNNTKHGLMYEGRAADGTQVKLSEGHIVASVLTYLRSQTQLVIGQAVTVADIHRFLKDKKLEK